MPDALADNPFHTLNANSTLQELDAALEPWVQSLRGLPEHERKAKYEAALEQLSHLGLIPSRSGRMAPGQPTSSAHDAACAMVRRWLVGLPGVRETYGDLFWRGPCPFHPLPHDGLVVAINGRSVHAHCAKGCKPEDIMAALSNRAMLTCLDQVKVEPLRWLWRDRIPRGKLTVFDGPPGIGKSTIALDLAARVTTGRPMPGETESREQAADVILIAHEDGLAETVRPRLDAAGADVRRVHHLEAILDSLGKEHGFRVRSRLASDIAKNRPDYLQALRHAIMVHKVSLVIIDPFVAYLAADAHKDQAVRAAMAPLAEIAEETGAAFLLIRHLRKRGGPALMAGGGAIGIIGAARAGLVIGVDPESPERHRILAQSKSNLGRPAAAWRLSLVPASPEGDTGVARIEWLQPCEVTADALTLQLSASGALAEADRGVVLDAVAWVKETLREGAMWADEFEAAGKLAGISLRTLQRATALAGTVALRAEVGTTWRYYRALPLPSGERPAAPIDPPLSSRAVVGGPAQTRIEERL